MICEICGKNKAQIIIQEVRKNESKEHHLCLACAKETGLSNVHRQAARILSKIISSPRIKGELLNTEAAKSRIDENTTCRFCLTQMKTIKESGFLGCVHCWDIWKDYAQVPKQPLYRGKMPRKEMKTNRKKMISIIENKLHIAIEKEEYEKAAKYRDQLRHYSQGDGHIEQ